MVVVVVAPAVLRGEFRRDYAGLTSSETSFPLPDHQGCVIVCVRVVLPEGRGEEGLAWYVPVWAY